MKKIYNFIFVITFLFVYIVPQSGFLYNNLIYLYYLVLVICSTLLVINNAKLKAKDYFLLFALFLILGVRFYFTLDIESLNLFFTIYVAFILIRSSYNVDKKIFKKVIVLSLISVCIQMLFLRDFNGTPVLSVLDPNYSGFYIFILYLSLDKLKSNLKYLAIFLGLLTFSRVFILAFLIYIIVKNVKITKFLQSRKLNNFFLIAILSCTILIGFSYYFVNNVQVNAQPFSIKKLYTFNDPSNMSRFQANTYFIDALINDGNFRLFGEDNIVEYQIKIYKNIPHNNFLDGIRRYGLLLYTIVFLCIGMVINKLFYNKNIPIIVSMFSYYTFLGGLTYGYKIILLIFVLQYVFEEKQGCNSMEEFNSSYLENMVKVAR